MSEKVITFEDFHDKRRCVDTLRIIHSHVSGLVQFEATGSVLKRDENPEDNHAFPNIHPIQKPKKSLTESGQLERIARNIQQKLFVEIADEAWELLAARKPDAYPLLLITGLLEDDDALEQVYSNPIPYEKAEWALVTEKMWRLHEGGGVVFFPSFNPREETSVVAIGGGGKDYAFRFYKGTHLDSLVAQKKTSIGIVNQMIRPFKRSS